MLAMSDQTVHSALASRIAVVPVGDIAPTTFAQYANVFKMFTSIPMADLTPPGDYSTERSAFKYVSLRCYTEVTKC